MDLTVTAAFAVHMYYILPTRKLKVVWILFNLVAFSDVSVELELLNRNIACTIFLKVIFGIVYTQFKY